MFNVNKVIMSRTRLLIPIYIREPGGGLRMVDTEFLRKMLPIGSEHTVIEFIIIRTFLESGEMYERG